MLRLPVALLVTLWALPALAEPVQVFVEDVKVELDGWDARQAEAFGKALAADLQSAVVKSPAFRPMTFENLQSQLRKEKRAEELSCSKTDEACIQKILDNYGCEERLYGTVRQVGDQAQVNLTRYLNEQLVEGGAASAYAKASAPDITAAATRLVRELFGLIATSVGGGPRGEEGRIGGAGADWNPELETGVVVAFDSDPPGALVELDGDVLCNAPCSRTVTRNTHRVALKMARYQTWQGDLDAARKTSMKGSLAPTFGWLTIRSTPAGLGLTLNGKPFGVTPVERKELDPGAYEVLVSDERYEPEGQRVHLDARESEVVDLVPKAKEGALKVEVVDDKGDAVAADVSVDGRIVGTAPWAGKLMVGEHAVSVKASDGRSAEKRVTVAYRQVGAETVTLPAPSGRLFGAQYTGHSDPNGATWTDPKTGLVWQRVAPERMYRWREARSYCESNEAGLPGLKWALPNIKELTTIQIDSKTGCNWPGELAGNCAWYWSSSFSRSLGPSSAWSAHFYNNNVDAQDLVTYNNVRCIVNASGVDKAGDIFVSPPSRAQEPSAVTWTDPKTGLVWQRIAPKASYNWENAKNYCESNQAGLPGSGWRLPDIDELKSILIEEKSGCMPGELEGACTLYWSSSSHSYNSDFAWGVSFYTGNSSRNSRTYTSFVRCVR